ncbi:MAG TPA: TolC family protein, partial [Candidatus Glassbacteria bacterium]|nr:TolC family protein [Candidatus Glassbacteria bacterium]
MIVRRKNRLYRLVRLCLVCALGPAFTGCAGYLRDGLTGKTAARPSGMWTPPALARVQPDTSAKKRELPAALLNEPDSLTLELIVDIALRNNPETRASWAAAKAAAARLGSEQGAYYPQLDASAQANKAQGSVAGGRFSYNQVAWGPALALNYLLFDFGKREADVESARQDLFASNWTHNATVQNVVLRVEQAYFQYLYAKALRQARQESVQEARENLDAAEERHKAGLATIIEVLQAKTNYSQALLSYQEVDGRVKTIRGALATAMGLPADIEYDVGFLPNELPVAMVSET